jgi:hypothetical protein
MGWPILIVVLGLAGGVAVARRLLPPLPSGPASGVASWMVGVLLGAAVAVVGLQAHDLIRALRDDSSFFGDSDAQAISYFATNALHLGGLLFGLAAIVYLLAMRLHGQANRR